MGIRWERPGISHVLPEYNYTFSCPSFTILTRQTKLFPQITGLENGTDYYVRVAAYNGPGGVNSSTNATEAFTTYGTPADADPFPVTTIEQVQ